MFVNSVILSSPRFSAVNSFTIHWQPLSHLQQTFLKYWHNTSISCWANVLTMFPPQLVKKACNQNCWNIATFLLIKCHAQEVFVREGILIWEGRGLFEGGGGFKTGFLIWKVQYYCNSLKLKKAEITSTQVLQEMQSFKALLKTWCSVRLYIPHWWI